MSLIENDNPTYEISMEAKQMPESEQASKFDYLFVKLPGNICLTHKVQDLHSLYDIFQGVTRHKSISSIFAYHK